MDTEKVCLIFPILQKFYSSLSYIAELDNRKYIFENIPKIDAFLQEFRNITFVMQKSFNTPELKQFYEKQRDKYLSDMKWFIDSRNTVTKEQAFRLDKKVILRIYNITNCDEFTTVITTNNDKSLEDIHQEINIILSNAYKEDIEIFYSISILFIEDGKNLDIHSMIIPGIIKMWKFVSEIQKSYPCSCKRCQKLNEQIKEHINKITQFNYSGLLIQDYYSYLGKTEIASRLETFAIGKEGLFLGQHPRIRLSNNQLFGKEAYNDHLKLLQRWTLHYVAIAQAQRKYSPLKDHEILPQFMLVFDDDTAELQPMFASTLKTTQYRKIFDIAERIKNENIIAVLHVCEMFTTCLNSENLKKEYTKRKNESISTLLCSFLVSKYFDSTMWIEIDYSKIQDDNYWIQQIRTPQATTCFMLLPILKALKEKNKDTH